MQAIEGKRNAEIGKTFGITIQAVTNTIKRVDKTREENERFNEQIMTLKQSLEAK